MRNNLSMTLWFVRWGSPFLEFYKDPTSLECSAGNKTLYNYNLKLKSQNFSSISFVIGQRSCARFSTKFCVTAIFFKFGGRPIFSLRSCGLLMSMA
jgi:hypothetical protein